MLCNNKVFSNLGRFSDPAKHMHTFGSMKQNKKIRRNIYYF